MNFVGIDPGMHGAVGALAIDGAPLFIRDSPIGLDGKYQRDTILYIVDKIRRLEPRTVAIELVGGMPTDGGHRAFKFGVGVEVWRMAMAAAGIVFSEVAPNKWKHHLGLTGYCTRVERKNASLRLARKLFPSAESELKRAMDDGRAEALLIAHYLRVTSVDGMRFIVADKGKESPEAMALMFGRPRRPKGFGF